MSEPNELTVSELLEPKPITLGWVLRVAAPILFLAALATEPFWLVWFRWIDQEDYYTHGPLILFVSMYLVLRKRKQLTGEPAPEMGPVYAGAIGAGVLYFVFSDLHWPMRALFVLLAAASTIYLVYQLRRLKPEPWKPGLLLLLPALLGCAIAGSHEIVSVGWFFALLVIVGFCLYYLGKRVSIVIAFPLLFLFTSVPLPEFAVQRATMPLKMFATSNTVTILTSRPIGIYCEQNGTTIQFPGRAGEKTKDVTVGAPCSGLRSLIALIAFGLLFGYITPLSRAKKCILFLATIPASFIANLIRILILALVTYHWDNNMATGDGLWRSMESWPGFSGLVPSLQRLTKSTEPVHDSTGILIFLIAFIGLFALERLLSRVEARQYRDRPREDGDAAATEAAHV